MYKSKSYTCFLIHSFYLISSRYLVSRSAQYSDKNSFELSASRKFKRKCLIQDGKMVTLANLLSLATGARLTAPKVAIFVHAAAVIKTHASMDAANGVRVRRKRAGVVPWSTSCKATC